MAQPVSNMGTVRIITGTNNDALLIDKSIDIIDSMLKTYPKNVLLHLP